MANQRRWTARERARLLSLAGTMSIRQISEALGRTDSSVKWQLFHLGTSNTQGRYTARQMAKELGVGYDVVRRVRDSLGARWCRGYDAPLATSDDLVRVAQTLLDPSYGSQARVSAAHLRRVIREHTEETE